MKRKENVVRFEMLANQAEKTKASMINDQPFITLPNDIEIPKVVDISQMHEPKKR